MSIKLSKAHVINCRVNFFNNIPSMPDPEGNPEPDPMPVCNSSFTWNEEQYTFIKKQ